MRSIARKAASLLLALSVALAPALLTAAPAVAQEPATLSLSKTASAETVRPGETFTYTLTLGCTTFGSGCVDAAVTDAIPSEFIVEGVPTVSGASAEASVDGQNVTVTFTDALASPAGAIGMTPATTAQIQILVRVDPDLPHSADGVPVTNTAAFDAANADPVTDDADVTPEVPLALAVETAKSFDPPQAVARPGTATTATLGVTDRSNGDIDHLRITEPADPSADPNPFDRLAFDGFGTVVFPEGADQVLVEVWVDGAWVAGEPGPEAALPDGADADDVRGVRLTFSDSGGDPLPAGASAEVELDLVQRDNVTDLDTETAIANTVTGETAAEGETATDDAGADYTILPLQITAEAGKSFDPDPVAAGRPSTVTLTGTNAGTPVDTMTITEPDPSTANPFEDGLAFTGLTDGVVWPSGATGASITYRYADGTSETLDATGPDTLPGPADGATVVGFTVVFTGDIVAGAQATIPFTVDTDPDQTEAEVVHDNQVLVEVADGDDTGSDTAADTLTTLAARLAVDADKRITPTEINAVPGEKVIVQLPARIEPFPASTTDADHLIVQDPATVPPNPDPDPFWNAFDATAITQTAIPAGATLTVSYWDGTEWVVLPGAEDLQGAAVVNLPVPAGLDVQGLKFDYYDPDGFPPGTSVQPNFQAALRDEDRDGSGAPAGGDAVDDCASAAASTDDLTANSDEACAHVDLIPVTPGEGELIDKTFLETEPGAGKTITARSGDEIDAELHWSTGGYSGLDEVAIADVADPAAGVGGTFFNAFDLVGIDPVTAADDPWLTYDAVDRVELWNGTAWVRAANDPCPDACDGAFPGYTLTDAERASTTAVRLVYTESPTRADRIGTDPTLPQVGDGVSRSSGNDRALRLTFRIRDEVRDPQADPDPVLGSREYNVDGSPGQVHDTAAATGYTDGNQVVRDEDGDDALIIDVPLNVGVAKDWTGGPLGIPPAGTDADAYPSGRVTVTATNRTAADVDALTITDPVDDDPYDVFDLKDIVAITVPEGATATAVTIAFADGTTADRTAEEALALPETDLADAVGITVAHTGRIESGAQAQLVLDLRLRAAHRDGGAPVTAADSPVANDAQASVADLGGTDDDAPTATDDARIELADIDIAVTAGKSFDPAAITEPSNGPVTMTITGRPGGTTRTNLMTLTDDEPLLWNQYDFSGFGDFAFTAPIDRVRVDAFTGGAFTDTGSGVEVTGGSWVTGEPATALALPDDVAAADVQGLRFTFTRADGAIWENPADPLQAVPIELVRRDELRTGGPVLTDLTGNDPAPGETAAGTATNTVDVRVQGAVTVDGEPVSATDTARATVLYRHAVNAVEVVKLADGAVDGGIKPPSTTFPYTIQVTNTGDRAIVDPVIRDAMPTDATGAQLTFDPDAHPGGEGAFSYALAGAAPDPASGPALPTDAAAVATDITGDVEQIVFTFPAGAVLEAGQTYTITIQLMVRPGVAGGTVVRNTAGVTGDRPWDECTGTLDDATGECRASAEVTVSSAASLRSAKTVRAEDDELGELSVSDDVPAEDCAPDAAGFFSSPCVPVLKPGGDHVWRYEAVNTGNLGLKEVVGFDELPRPGDTGAVNTNQRGSQWRPVFEGTARLTTPVPDGTELRLYWTDEVVVCSRTVDCPDESWTLFPQHGGPAFTEEILDGIEALRYEAVFPDGDLFDPLERIGFEFVMTAPAYSDTAGKDTIAWNSASIGGRTAATATEQAQDLPLTEGERVGVALATGHLAVTKTVTGDGAAYAPDAFTLHLACRSAIGTRVEDDVPLGDKATVTVTPGETTTVTDLPYGAECTVTEDGAAGATSFTATTVTVVRDDEDPEVIAAENVYDLAGLVVRKTVDTTAVDQDGNPITYGPFTIGVDCTFLGEPVYADGYGPGDPMTAELADGGQAEFTGLPAGAECTVTETDAKGAEVTVTATTADGSTDTDGDSAVVTLTPDRGGAATNTAAVHNAYGSGTLALTKDVLGAGTGPVTPGPFTIEVTCTLDDASGSRVVWEGTVVLGGTRPLDAEITDIAAGAVCTGVETGQGGATFAVVTPSRVTVDSGETVTLRAVNVLTAGSLRIVKEVTGDGADRYGAGPFAVALDCVFDTGQGMVPVAIPGGPTREFSVDEPAVYEDLPTGAECTATETLTGGATEATIGGGVDDGPTAIVPDRDQAELTATNRFDTGGLTVAKRLDGEGAADHRGDAFTFFLACTRTVDGDRVALEVPGGPERTVTGGGTASYEDLPAGASCALTETGDGGAASTAVTVDGAEGGEFTVAACDEAVCNEAEVTNTWPGPALSATGGDLADLLRTAALLTVLGAAMLGLTRRRRSDLDLRG